MNQRSMWRKDAKGLKLVPTINTGGTSGTTPGRLEYKRLANSLAFLDILLHPGQWQQALALLQHVAYT